MTGQVPYGCLWADEKRQSWVIDEDAAPLWRGCPHRRGTRGNTQKKGTQGQAASELFAPQGKRQTKGMGGKIQCQAESYHRCRESHYPRRGHGEGRVYPC